MTKARTRAARRRARQEARKRISLPGGDEIAAKPAQGRRADLEQARSARQTAAEARVRVFGGQGSPDPEKAASDPLQGSCAGNAIRHVCADPSRASALWGVWLDLLATRRRYLAAIGTSDSPQASHVAAIPERIETDPTVRHDPRSLEERHAAAIRAHAHQCSRIGNLPANVRHVLRAVLVGTWPEDVLWRDHKITGRGARFVRALRLLADREKQEPHHRA